MREKHLALIRILVDQEEWMTAKQLSLQLHISECSVKSYIGEINYFESSLIEGSRKGYRIQKDRGRELDKRRLLSGILYEEFNKNIMSLDMV